METRIVPLSVRVLPLGTKKIWGEEGNGSKIEDVQDWLLNDLISREPPGRYCSFGPLMKAKQGTVVLFQYQNQIIGRAELIRTEKEEDRTSPFKGYYYFSPENIETFDPVPFDTMRDIFGEAWYDKKNGIGRKGLYQFQQLLWNLNPDQYYRFEEILNNIRSTEHPLYPDSFPVTQQR